MENKFKQMRVKFSGIDEVHEAETLHARDRKITSQKTRSFNGDGRRVQNRYRGQSSRDLTYDYESDYMESDEFRTAVAAAAYAIDSVEEQRRTRRRHDGSLSKPKSKQGGAVFVPERIRERIPSSSSSSSRNKMKNKEDDNVHISTPSFLSRKISELQEKMPQRARSPVNTEPKPVVTTSGYSDPKLTNQPTPSPTEVGTKPPPLSPYDIKAEVWEKTELERIKERYDKLNAKILEWENEKKAKARKKLSRNKDEPEKKRAKALQVYKNDMEMIEQIAEGARSQAEDNRRKDVIKIKKKADTIRLTGNVPTKTCLCF